MSQFDESKHRRHQDGKFANKPHAEAEGVSLTMQEDAWEPPADTPQNILDEGYALRPSASREEVLAVGQGWNPRLLDWRSHPALDASDLAAHATATRHGDRYDIPNESFEEYKRRMEPDKDVSWGEVAALAKASQPERIRLVALAHPNLPQATIKRVAASPDDKVRWALAKNPATPSDVLYGYTQEGWAISTDAASNPNLSEEHMRLALKSDVPGMDYAVAANPSAPADILDTLSRSEDEGVVERVAANPATPTEVLERLATSDESAIREAIVSNPSTPVATVDQIVTTADPNHPLTRQLLTAANSNPNLSEKSLRVLTQHVPNEALRNPNMTDELATQAMASLGPGNQPRHYRHDTTHPAPSLAALAGSSHPFTREMVALNSNTPTPTLKQLAKDEDNHVRLAATRTLVSRFAG